MKFRAKKYKKTAIKPCTIKKHFVYLHYKVN